MATHSNILVWRVPGTGVPTRLPSMGSHRAGHDWSDLAASAWVCALELANSSRDVNQAAFSACGTSSHPRSKSCIIISHMFCTHRSICLEGPSPRYFPVATVVASVSDLTSGLASLSLSLFHDELLLPWDWSYLEYTAGLGFISVSPEPDGALGKCFLLKIGPRIVTDKILSFI